MSKAKIPLEFAQAMADEFMMCLSLCTARRVIAGSIRRCKETVGDIELVVTPKYDEERVSLFDTALVNQLVPYLKDLAANGIIEPRQNRNGHNIAWLPRDNRELNYVALWWCDIPIDLFVVNADNLDSWGYILWLRTGPGDANKLMVTGRYQGGMCPDDIAMSDGKVYRRGQAVPIPDEAAMFDVLQLLYVPPELRSVEAYRSARAGWLATRA